MENIKKSILSAMILSIAAQASATGLSSLDDNEMSEAVGQALLYMGTTQGSTISGGDYSAFTFYKMGFQAEIEANLNIKTLQLGCGGVNGPDGCDIDIENLSLTGVPTEIKADGTPVWNYSGATSGGNKVNERAASSAVLKNPFVEFAIKNPNDLALREVAGVRLSADGIKGYMTAGTYNDSATSTLNRGGINTFSGYITTAPSPVIASTQQAVFGKRHDEIINAPLRLSALIANENLNSFTNVKGMGTGTGAVTEYPSGFNSWGVNLPSLTVNFNFPKTVVTGNRMSQLDLKVDDVPIGAIAVGHKDGPVLMSLDRSVLGMAGATFFMGQENSWSWIVRDCPIGGTNTCGMTTAQKQANDRLRQATNPYTGQTFKVGESGCLNGSNAVTTGACTWITNLYANVGVKQNFTRMHNLPVATTITSGAGYNGKGEYITNCSATVPCFDFNKGFYLSLQKEALRWPGSNGAYVTNKATGAVTTVADNYRNTSTSQVFSPADIAQPGWWMSFSEPLNFGTLQPTTQVPMEAVTPQVATFINQFFAQQRLNGSGQPLYGGSCGLFTGYTCARSTIGSDVSLGYRAATNGTTSQPVPRNIVGIDLWTGLSALIGAPLYVPLGNINVAGTPAVMEMSDLPLTNYQAVVPNCWGNLKFC